MELQNTTTNHILGASVAGSIQGDVRVNINHYPSGTSIATNLSSIRFGIQIPTTHFKGRVKTMEEVRDFFTNLPKQSSHYMDRMAAIVGLGGMEKTETAYKFAAEYKESFPNVVWINAETEHGALTSFLGLAKLLNIVSRDTIVKDVDPKLAQQVYRHIDEMDYGNVLFIFDNAIQLSSAGPEFGILGFLPTDELPNKRFPNILITTQTKNWGRRIQTFQVDELCKDESLEFFRSCFNLESTECDDLFGKLHKLLQGYPLVMNLAASQIDYIPKKDSIRHLREELKKYADKLEEEYKKIMNEKMDETWDTKYHHTLVTVWQLTFERIQKENQGPDALELLQLMSFLRVPMLSNDVVQVLVLGTGCPHPPTKELQFRVKELLRVLERFYTVRILKVVTENEEEFECDLGIHRLVQLVVRQQIDCSQVLERVLYHFASDHIYNRQVNLPALEEALLDRTLSQRTLSQWTWPYVGILACWGIPAACKFVEARQPETKAAATIWRLYYLERGMTTLNDNAIQVIRELVGLSESEDRLQEREYFAHVTICLLSDNEYFKHKNDDGTVASSYFSLQSLDGIEELVAEFIMNVCPIQDSICRSYHCRNNKKSRDLPLAALTIQLSKTFIRADAPNSTSTVDVIAETWFAFSARQRRFHEDEPRRRFFLNVFWSGAKEIFHSPDASKSRIAMLRRGLWDRGLATELVQELAFISRFLVRLTGNSYSMLLNLMDVCMDGMDLKDERVQQVMSSFCEMIVTIEAEFTSVDHSDVPDKYKHFAVELCSVWVKLLLINGDPTSPKLLECLSPLKFLDWMERSPLLHMDEKPFLRDALRGVPEEYLSQHFPQFTQRFSSSDNKQIQTLVNVCQRLLEEQNKKKVNLGGVSYSE